MYETLGNAEATAVVTQSVALMARIVASHGGQVVKTLGDGLMAMFPTPSAAVAAADEMHDSLGRIGAARGRRAAAAHRLRCAPAAKLQVGLAHGEVVEMSGDCFGDAVNVAARLLDHAGDNETLVTAERRRRRSANGSARAFAASTGCSCAAASSRCMCTCSECVRRFGDTARHGVRRHRCRPSPEPEGIRLVWLDLNRVYAGDQPAGGARAQPAGHLHHRRQPRLALARAHRLARRHLPAHRPELQRHLRALRQRPRDHQPAPRRLHPARQRRHRPGRRPPSRCSPSDPLRGAEVRRHAAAAPGSTRRRAMRFARSRSSPTGPSALRDPAGAIWARPTRRRPRQCASYLAEFLSRPTGGRDSAHCWWPIPARRHPAHAAGALARPSTPAIWTAEGSPLVGVDATSRRAACWATLGERGHAVLVQPAMRYGQPSVASALDALKSPGPTRILVLPLYPQYAAARPRASAFDAVGRLDTARAATLPELRVVNHFHDDPGLHRQRWPSRVSASTGRARPRPDSWC